MTSPRILLITRASILVWTEWWMKPISPHTAHYEPFHSWWHLAAFIYWALEVWDSIPVHLILLKCTCDIKKNKKKQEIRLGVWIIAQLCFLDYFHQCQHRPPQPPTPRHVLPVCEQFKKINCLRQKVRGKKLPISVKHAIKQGLAASCLL